MSDDTTTKKKTATTATTTKKTTPTTPTHSVDGGSAAPEAVKDWIALERVGERRLRRR